jgi:branched-chain amino acid transport system ATP-binding protein
MAADARARHGIRLVPERRKVFALQTVDENLALFHGRRLDAATREQVWLHFPLLERLRQRKAGNLSGGERQMLALTVAVLAPVRLLLVDEMSLGLAPVAAQQASDVLRQLQRERGFTVLMVEQNRSLADQADGVIELDEHG